MSGVAIVKPDHIGDLVLAVPAVRAVAAAHPGTTLFVASKNRRLAQYLFPDLEIRTIDLPHLVKDGAGAAEPDLGGFDLVVLLRADQVLDEGWARLRTRVCVLPHESLQDHQTLIDYSVVYGTSGAYDIDALFFGARHAGIVARAAAVPRRVGLSLGSGFHANAWPLTRWIRLAREVLEAADEVVLLGGPAEAAKAEAVVARLGAPARLSSLAGRLDPTDVVRRCEELDLVVASDGGTGHLCSLSSPVLSLFGPSPFRRYAPFGRTNRVLTRDLPCSPCCQYTTHLVNGCFTTECLGRIDVPHVRKAMRMPVAAHSRPRAAPLEGDVGLWHGVSHIGRDAKLAAFREEMADAARAAE